MRFIFKSPRIAERFSHTSSVEILEKALNLRKSSEVTSDKFQIKESIGLHSLTLLVLQPHITDEEPPKEKLQQRIFVGEFSI